MADRDFERLVKTLESESTKQLKADKEAAAEQKQVLDELVASLKESGIDTKTNSKVNRERAKLEKIDFQIKLRGVKDRKERLKLLDEQFVNDKKMLTFFQKNFGRSGEAKSKEKEDRKQREAEEKKNRGFLKRIADGITSLPSVVAEGAGAGAKKGLGGILSIFSFLFGGGLFKIIGSFVKKIPKFALLGLPVLLLSVFDAEDFKKFGAFLKEKVLPAINTFYNETVKPAFESLMEFFKNEAFPAIKTFIMDEAIPAITRVYEDILKPAFTSIVDFLKTDGIAAIKTLFEKLKEFYVKIEPNLKALFNFLAETTIPALVEGIKNLFLQVAEIFGKIFDFLGNIISGDFTAAFGDLVDIGKLIIKAIMGVVDTVLGMFGIEFEGGILNAITGIFTGIIKTLENLIRKLPGGDFIADKLFGERSSEELDKEEREEMMKTVKSAGDRGVKIKEGARKGERVTGDEALAELARREIVDTEEDLQEQREKLEKLRQKKDFDPQDKNYIKALEKEQRLVEKLERGNNQLLAARQGNFEIKEEQLEIPSMVAENRVNNLDENARAKSENANSGDINAMSYQDMSNKSITTNNSIQEGGIFITPNGGDNDALNLASNPTG